MKQTKFMLEMSIEEFEKHYWYKIELKEICQEYQLPIYGTKYELSEYIIRLLKVESTNKIKPIRKKNRRGLPAYQITPKTKILESSFSLNNQSRQFFCSYYGVEKFSFKKSMGIKMREIEAQQDTNATVQDLIDVYEQKTVDLSKNKEEQTYQWNNFVRDFSNDSLAKDYHSPMKVAAYLWKEVKDSDQEKKYSHDLLITHQKEISRYLKSMKDK